MKTGLLAIGLLLSLSVIAQRNDETAIKQLLHTQTESWNRGDIEGFMQTYWHNDSLMFIGKNGIQWGWQNTLNRYKKAYPDTTAMGQLSFNIITIKPLSPIYYYVVGQWKLQRSIVNLSGHFDLLLRKIEDRWYIISDHSS